MNATEDVVVSGAEIARQISGRAFRATVYATCICGNTAFLL